MPVCLSHVEGEDWPGQSLQLCGGSCPGCCRARMGELDMLFHQFEHHLPCRSVWWSLVVTSWGLALQGSRRRHDVDQGSLNETRLVNVCLSGGHVVSEVLDCRLERPSCWNHFTRENHQGYSFVLNRDKLCHFTIYWNRMFCK